jgi:hypothetical protein
MAEGLPLHMLTMVSSGEIFRLPRVRGCPDHKTNPGADARGDLHAKILYARMPRNKAATAACLAAGPDCPRQFMRAVKTTFIRL